MNCTEFDWVHRMIVESIWSFEACVCMSQGEVLKLWSSRLCVLHWSCEALKRASSWVFRFGCKFPKLASLRLWGEALKLWSSRLRGAALQLASSRLRVFGQILQQPRCQLNAQIRFPMSHPVAQGLHHLGPPTRSRWRKPTDWTWQLHVTLSWHSLRQDCHGPRGANVSQISDLKWYLWL